MNFDGSKLEAFAALPDDILWSEVRKMAGAHGLSLPAEAPPHDELEKLRAMCTGATKISMLQAMRIVNDLKRRGGK